MLVCKLMSIKFSFCWFLRLQHLNLSFFRKSFEKLIRVKNTSKSVKPCWFKTNTSKQISLCRDGYLHYSLLSSIPVNETQNIKWFLLCKCNGIYYYCSMVNRKFKIYYCFDLCLNSTGFLEKDKGNLFLSTYVAYSANELAVIYGFSLLKIDKGRIHRKQWQLS